MKLTSTSSEVDEQKSGCHMKSLNEDSHRLQLFDKVRSNIQAVTPSVVLSTCGMLRVAFASWHRGARPTSRDEHTMPRMRNLAAAMTAACQDPDAMCELVTKSRDGFDTETGRNSSKKTSLRLLGEGSD